MRELVPFVLAFALTSCATVKNGKYQNVCLNSTPEGAAVWVNQSFVGQTPASVCLKRDQAQQVSIQLEGYKPYHATLYPTVSGWVFGNILVGGFVGMAIDAYTGSMYKLSPSQLHACLEMENETIVSHQKISENCEVIVVNETDPSWEKIDSLQQVN